MFVFITSLRHPNNIKSKSNAYKLLEKTLKSVCNQTSYEFKALVVCNEIPKIKFKHPNLIYIVRNLIPPFDNSKEYFEAEGTPKINGIRWDRGRKYLIGLLYAQKFNPTHIMFFDSDDLISKNIVNFVRKNLNCDGWFINRGYIYDEKTGSISLMEKDFDHICGTCHIIKFDLFELSKITKNSLSENSIKFLDLQWPTKISEYSKKYIMLNLGSHQYIKNVLRKQGHILNQLPFIGAVYIIGHGENWNNEFRITKNNIILTNSIREEFSLYSIC